MRSVIRFLSSMQFMSILILVFAFAIGYATFIENDFGRSTAKALVFNTWWFEVILIFLIYILVYTVIKSKWIQQKKIPILVFHLAFVIILIGSCITRYISYEGMMHIRENEDTNLFISDDTFLQIHINVKKHQYNYDKKLFLSAITNNKFNVKVNFKNHDIDISYLNFLPNVKDSIYLDNEEGRLLLHLVVPGVDGMKDEYVFDKEQKDIKNEIITLNNPKDGAINFISKGQDIYCVSPYNVSTMSMLTREATNINALDTFSFNRKTLHTINGLSIVLKNISLSAKKGLMSSSKKMVDGNQDGLTLLVRANGQEKIVDLIGCIGFKGPEEFFSGGDLFFKLSYGSKYYTTPFRLRLRDFQLERYPGSSSPKSYAAEVTILDREKEIPYRIYMNNVLQYKGYRFFQSSYDEDEQGTILSVNHDWWGTYVTYVGYFLLFLGFILVFFSKKTRFHFLTKQLNKIRLKSTNTEF